MDYQALATLIQTNPDWQVLSDDDLALWVNDKTEQQVAERLNAEDMYEAIDGAEFTALSPDAQAEIWNILLLHATSGIPTAPGKRARTRIVAIFNGKPTTINNLVEKITYLVSRATAASVGKDTVTAGDVKFARTYV